MPTTPIFSKYWVIVPPHSARDEIMVDLPPFTKLVKALKDENELGEFLQDVNKRENLKQEVSELLIKKFEQKLQTLWKADDKEILKIKEELQALKKKFDYDGSNPVTNQKYYISYRDGVPLLFKVLHIIEQESKSFSDDLLKITMLSLFDGMNLCFPGIHTRATYAWMQLSAPTPEHQLMNIRQEMAKKEVLLRLRPHALMQEEGMGGNEIHFVNSILNYFANRFGLLKIDDSFALDLSKSNDYKPSQNGYHWYVSLKQIAKDVLPCLTPKAVFEQLAENIAGEIRTFKDDSERDDKIKALLDRYGTDEDFHVAYHVITETGKLQSEKELLQNMRLTLLKRYASVKNLYLGVLEYPLTPTMTLYQFSDESFNYVIEASGLGSAPRRIPLSTYLLKAASGYPVSLVTQDNEEELQIDLQKNIITPPALIKSGDNVQIYGMVEGKPTLAEHKLDLSSIDWNLDSTTLSNECYSVIAEHKAHQEPTPIELLKEMNRLMLTYSKTVLSLFTPQNLSLLSKNGWSNIILSLLENPTIDKIPLFFGTNTLKASSDKSFFYVAVLYGQADAVGKLLTFAKSVLPEDKWKEETLLRAVNSATPLFIAAEKDYPAVVEHLLTDLNYANRLAYLKQANARDTTPLYIAAQNGHVAIVEQLLAGLIYTDRIAYLKQARNDGATSLYIAAQNGHVLVVEKLLSGLTYADRVAFLKQARNDGATPLYIAVHNGHVVVVEQLLAGLTYADRVALLKQACNDGVIPLYLAAQNGHVAMVEQLLAGLTYADRVALLKQAMNNGATPLYIAAENGHVAVVEQLLAGLTYADRVACLKQANARSVTPLFIAAQKGHVTVIKKLLAGLNYADRVAFLKQTKTGDITPLCIAAANGHIEVIEQLLEGLNPVDRLTYLKQACYNGATPLLIALERGHFTVVEKLLEVLDPVDRVEYIKQQAHDTLTPLFIAAQNGYFEVIKVLISNALSSDILTPAFISTPESLIRFAQKKNVLSAMNDYLRSHPPDQDGKVKMIPIDIAKIMGHQEIVTYLSHQTAIAETPVYEYARNIDKEMTTAAGNGWTDVTQALNKHKNAVIDPDKKIEEVLIEQKGEIGRLIEALQNTQSAPSSTFYGNSGNKAIKIAFIKNIERTIDEFQSKRLEHSTCSPRLHS